MEFKKILFAILTLPFIGLAACSDDDKLSGQEYPPEAVNETFNYEGLRFRVLPDNTVEVLMDPVPTQDDYGNPYYFSSYSGDIAIPEYAVYNDVKYSVSRIGEQAFFGSKVTIVDIPSTVTTFGKGAFSYCSITDIKIPSSVTLIDDECFKGVDYLSQIDIPESVTKIGKGAFSWSKIATFNLPNSLTAIEEETFHMCRALKEITLPENIRQIGEKAFSSCLLLESVTLNENLLYIDDEAFENCYALKSFIVPDKVTVLGDKVLYNAKQMTTLHIGSSVQEIGEEAFDLCQSLIDIKISENNGNFTYDGQVIYNKELTEIVFCRYDVESLVLPETIVTIPNDSFSNRSKLKSVILPANLQSIGDYAFTYDSLTEIVIPDKVKSIGRDAFSVNSIQKVVLGKSVEFIGDDAFNFNPITEVYCYNPQPPTLIVEGTYLNNPFGDQENLIIYVPQESLKLYQESPAWKDLKIEAIP